MRKSRKIKAAVGSLLAIIMMFAMLPLAGLAAEQSFPLEAYGSNELVANENTEYAVEFEQDPISRMITATFVVKNGNPDGDGPIFFEGVGVQLSFDDTVAPYSYDPKNPNDREFDISRMYTNKSGLTGSIVEFMKYCYAPCAAIERIGSQLLRNDATGRYIRAKISVGEQEQNVSQISLDEGESLAVAQMFFMPTAFNAVLDPDMFKFEFTVYNTLMIKLSTWIANGNRYLVSNSSFPSDSYLYVVSPTSFNMYFPQSRPAVSANNTSRTVNGYDDEDMEWADSLGGPYSSDPAPLVENDLENDRTIYVRYAAAVIPGTDGEYTDYKHYKASEAVPVTFSGGSDQSEKSEKPSIDRIIAGDREITGGGRPGAKIDVTVVLPNGTEFDTVVIVDRNGVWSVDLENYELQNGEVKKIDLAGGEVIRAIQTENGKQPSDKVERGVGTDPPTYVKAKFHPNGGWFNSLEDRNKSEVEIVVTLGEKYGTLPGVTRTGYEFASWRVVVEDENGVPSLLPDLIKADTWVFLSVDHDLYARWDYRGSDGGGGNPPGNNNGNKDPDKPPPGFTQQHIPYINGYPDNSMRPENAITRAEAAMIFFRLLTDSDKETQKPSVFLDIRSGEWYYQAINYLASRNILLGYPDGRFRPNQAISRAEFAAIASRFDNLSESSTNAFSDITGHWAVSFINSAYMKGWVSGYPDGTFKPTQNIKRSEVVTIVNTMLNRKIRAEDIPSGIRLFSDISGHWAYADIVEASNNHDYVRKDDGYEIWQLR
ncbi:MAG: S-layer homology domain-containing protein [Oscillospiraceae bacterium]|nr:S-layer homology domain-containing protein [Oscillospiraceae bacterium]